MRHLFSVVHCKPGAFGAVVALMVWGGLVGAVADVADAHGLRPIPRMLYQEPNDDDLQVLVSSDQGLHLTQDGGDTWYWVCEDIIGSDVYAFSVAGPVVEDATEPRTWIAGGIGQTQGGQPQDIDGVYLSQDAGCNWTPATGALAGQWASVILTHPERLDEVLVATQHANRTNGVAITEDGGQTWVWTELEGIDGVLFARNRWVNAMVRASADPEVVYASTTNAMHTSTDGGRTWTRWGEQLILNDTDILEVHQVDPLDAQAVYFSLYDPQGRTLYVSRDGGQTMEPLKESNTRDGVSLAIIPEEEEGEGRLFVLATDLGSVFRSRDEGATWIEEGPITPVECLIGDQTRPGSVYVCQNLYAQLGGVEPFALGRSSDGLEGVDRWFTYADIEGHQNCPENSQVNQICVPLELEMMNNGTTGDAGADTSPMADTGTDGADTDDADTGMPVDSGAEVEGSGG
ncbi:MAG: hypothetical protein AAFX99_26025, partial [Myxococcota bacterium]